MIETNIRILDPGPQFHMDTRDVIVVSGDISPDVMERACHRLGRHHKLAAIPNPFSGRHPSLLVASAKPLRALVLQGEDWRLDLRDAGHARRLHCSDPEEAPCLARLVERQILLHIADKADLWTLDSLRILYKSRPFTRDDDISAYRRFHISVLPIRSVGLGIVTHVSTAFFTDLTVADYFCAGTADSESERLRQRFDLLAQRQRGQKGTLLYDLGKSKHKCYFGEFLDDVTCATTGPFRVSGHTYTSLYEYYRRKHPDVAAREDDPVATVSFSGLDRPKPVAANKLRLRVMNEALPASLRPVDKISPSERSKLIEEFWDQLGNGPLDGRIGADLWQPDNKKMALIPAPSLGFADDRRVDAPQDATQEAYRKYYRARRALLNKVGCLDVPPAIERVLRFAVPSKASDEMADRISQDITMRLSQWTGKNLTHQVVGYSTLEEAVTLLDEPLALLQGMGGSGVVVFVFESEDPADYFNLSYQLKLWRIKRIRYSELERFFHQLAEAEAQLQQRNGPRNPKGLLDWRSFVEMSSLDVLQQLDCVLWSITTPLNYEAQLAIDVGADRRHFALSLLICRDRQLSPSFSLDTIVKPKPDPKHETINRIVLRDEIVEIFRRAKRTGFVPIRSLLVLRDGRQCGQEMEGIKAAERNLVSLGLLNRDSRVDVVDFHKRSVKGIRMWRKVNSEITNVLEGTALLLNEETVVLANTGAGTITQGTANPCMLVARSQGMDMLSVATDVFATAQLNWSNPRVAQRLPIPLKRTDEELRKRSAQEIRRIK